MNPPRSDACSDRSGSAAPAGRSRPRARRQTPHGLEQRVLARAREAGFDPQDRIVVGFSGGRDSLALAAALRRARSSLGIEPLLIHIDHRLRASSGDEAARAADLAAALGMEMQTNAISPPTDTHPGVGVEEAARRERYRILFETAARHGARAVATAHHQQDQAETVLMHLLRGGGVHGAAGMAERGPSPVSSIRSPNNISHLSSQTQPEPESRSQPWLWRPLLSEPREVLTAYVRRLGLEPVEDPSNTDTTLRRNALRHGIVPALELVVPGAIAALARYAALAAEDDRALEDLARTAGGEIVDPGGRLAVTPLRAQPLAIQRRVVRRWLAGITASGALTAERTDAVLALAGAGRSGAAIEIGEGWTVRVERGMLRAFRGGNQHGEGQ